MKRQVVTQDTVESGRETSHGENQGATKVKNMIVSPLVIRTYAKKTHRKQTRKGFEKKYNPIVGGRKWSRNTTHLRGIYLK